jgi:nucleotide-binding universal stress UspA family protein
MKEIAMFKNIVWATDGSAAASAALPCVESLAEADGASVVVVHAVETFVTGYSHGLPVYGDTEEVKSRIARQVEDLRSKGVPVDATIVHAGRNRPADLIADTARTVKADVIVLGSRGHTALGGLLVGSVTQRVIHIAPCPVLVVPAPPHDEDREVATAEAATA